MHFAVVVALAAPFRVASAYAAIQADGAAATSIAFDDLEIELTLPALTELAPATPELDTCKGEWLGKLGSSEARVQLFVLEKDDYDFFEPEDVVETWRDSIRDPEPDAEGKHHEFAFEPTRCVAGTGGCTPIVATAQGLKTSKTDAAQKYAVVLVGSLLPGHGWTVRADVSPPPAADALRAFVAELEKCVTYKGKPCDPKWTDEEAKKFWQSIAPESTWKKFEKPTRTKHFIVLTNSTSPGPFVKKLEGWYSSIAKIVPTDELEGRKLLPIVLFRTDDDFQNFYREHFQMEPGDNVRETSILIDDFLATSCDYDDEYERLLDLSKQALHVRARARHGNLWLRQGLRTYAATKPRDRSPLHKAVKKERYMELAKLLVDADWNLNPDDARYDKPPLTNDAGYWSQSALWIEFFVEGPWPKDSFSRLIRVVGTIPGDDHEGILTAIESLYGMKLEQLQKKWIEYFSKK
ncbi:MAG: hypothetical protein ACKVWV_00595 [Planctomycetota bacterium]